MRGFQVSAFVVFAFAPIFLFADDKFQEGDSRLVGCREAIIRFQAQPARMIVTNNINTSLSEVVGDDSATTYIPNWRVEAGQDGVQLVFGFEGGQAARVVLEMPYVESETYTLRQFLPRGEANAIEDLNLMTEVLKHLGARSVFGERIIWELDDPHLIEELNEKLNTISQGLSLDLSSDARQATADIEQDPMFYNALDWNLISDSYFSMTTISAGEEALKRLNSDRIVQEALRNALKGHPVGKALLASESWDVQIEFVAVKDYLLPLIKREAEASEDQPPLFPFRYRIVLQSY